MLHPVDTKDRHAVENEVGSFYLKIFPSGDRSFIPIVFGWVLDCFQGRYRDYQPIDVLYHDLEHTLQGTLCMARLLWGYHRAQALPSLEQRMVELGLMAILLHDTGYLKKRGDSEGTGAKYTLIHVSRSADFAQQLLSEKDFPDPEIAAVQRMIRCTGVDADLNAISFASELEKEGWFYVGHGRFIGPNGSGRLCRKTPRAVFPNLPSRPASMRGRWDLWETLIARTISCSEPPFSGRSMFFRRLTGISKDFTGF